MIRSICYTENEIDSFPFVFRAYEYLNNVKEMGHIPAVSYQIKELNPRFVTVSLIECVNKLILDNFNDTLRTAKNQIEVTNFFNVEYCSSFNVEEELYHLVDSWNENKLTDPVEFFERFLHIHPFVDGNGRTAKLIFWFITDLKPYWSNQIDLCYCLLKRSKILLTRYFSGLDYQNVRRTRMGSLSNST